MSEYRVIGICAMLTMFALGVVVGFWAGSGSDMVQVKEKTQQQIYQVGDKVKYGIYDGTITGEYKGNRYTVNYCGNIGWFNKYECQEILVGADKIGNR